MDMEYNVPQAQPYCGGDIVPSLAQKQPFSASNREKIAALTIYLAAYCYLGRWPAGLAVFCALFVAAGELLYWNVRRSEESFVWLVCLAVICVSRVLGRGQVWGEYYGLFLHLFGVYWLLVRSGRLVMGESSTLLPLDALHGFVVIPFKHFFLRIRTVWYALTHLRRSERKKTQPETVLALVLALIATLALLFCEGSLLMRADAGFARLFDNLRFELHLDAEVCIRLLLSLPVGAYVFGLAAGAGREAQEKLRARGDAVCAGVLRLRRVPNAVWTAVLAVFLALYVLFFCVQGAYLFGAFQRRLPDGFTVAAYARQGFFELCGVMALNFALLWLVTRTGDRPARDNRAVCALYIALLAAGMLFAVVACSKLILYISCFGFTPKRLQSTWLVCVLFFGCAASGYSFLTGKKSFRAWMMFGAVTLALLSVY